MAGTHLLRRVTGAAALAAGSVLLLSAPASAQDYGTGNPPPQQPAVDTGAPAGGAPAGGAPAGGAAPAVQTGVGGGAAPAVAAAPRQTSSGSRGESLPVTGGDVLGLVVVGGVALAGGTAMVAAGRRRRA